MAAVNHKGQFLCHVTFTCLILLNGNYLQLDGLIEEGVERYNRHDYF